jgi:hypothetical protein
MVVTDPEPDRPSFGAGEFEAGPRAGTAAPAERGHHRRHHAIRWLATALGARVLCASILDCRSAPRTGRA